MKLVCRGISLRSQIGHGRKRRQGVIILFLVLFMPTVTPAPALAVSAWDNLIVPTAKLELADDYGETNTDATDTYLLLIKNLCGNSYELLSTAMSDQNGRWVVVQILGGPVAQDYRAIYVGWSTDANDVTSFLERDSERFVTAHAQHSVVLQQFSDGARTCRESTDKEIILANENNDYRVYSSNYPIEYPSGYGGQAIPIVEDTDGDGLKDELESVHNANRDQVFCNTSTSPYVCSYPDPLIKDIYLEVDWMKDGQVVYKPTAIQIEYVKSMFANKDINLHVDTGQYGGGNELATFTKSLPYTVGDGTVDYADYKNGGDGVSPNYSTHRKSVWRYMITGHEYAENKNRSGWAEVMGENLFLAIGMIKNGNGYASMDHAIANTIAHEIGHTLCLSDRRVYVEQPSECIYEGIDNKESSSAYYNLKDYKSAMNYRYQLTDIDNMGITDYSNGISESNDHNDWLAVMKGMKGFSGSFTLFGSGGATGYQMKQNGPVIIEENLTVGPADDEEGTLTIIRDDPVVFEGVSQGFSDTNSLRVSNMAMGYQMPRGGSAIVEEDFDMELSDEGRNTPLSNESEPINSMGSQYVDTIAPNIDLWKLMIFWAVGGVVIIVLITLFVKHRRRL